MMYTSLAVLAMSASAAVSPLSRFVHMHPHNAQPDTRVSVTLHNATTHFQDVRVGGHTYTILSNRGLDIKAPAGTVVVADSPSLLYKRGDVVVAMSAATNEQTINLK